MEQSIIEAKESLVEWANQHNVFLSPEALTRLEQEPLEDAKKALEELANENVFIVDSKALENKLARTKIIPQSVEVRGFQEFKPLAKEYSADYRELREYNLSAAQKSDGSIQDFVRLFQDRLSFLESVLKSRQGFSPKPIKALKESTQKRDVDFVGMANEKWITKNGHLAFRFEDAEDECIALVLKDNEPLLKQAKQLILDEVVGVKGSKGVGDLVIIKELFQPDLPLRPMKTADVPLSACVISDIHVGSKLFLEKEFHKFLSWLSGKEGDEKERALAGSIKYLFVCGDNVDGIGVYPDQIKNLSIKDLFEQYKGLEEVLLQVPEHIEVFIIPGQHDSVRWADPQPSISKEYCPRLHSLSNYHFLPSPGWIEFEGFKTVMYHGAALHELYDTVPHLTMTKPELAMIEMLKRRSFLINYGNKQPYAPEKKDFLSMREVPDFYFGGDMHHIGFDTYRGCTVLNASCFQSQTDYEVKLGHVPTPSLAAIIPLKSRQIAVKNFGEEAR